MNIDGYITDITDTPDTPGEALTIKKEKSENVLAAERKDREELTRKKNILISVNSYGNLESYIGKKLSADKIRKMKKEEFDSYFSLYQEKAAQETTNEIMSSLLDISIKGLSYVVDIDNEEELKNDLIKNKQLRRTIGKQLVGITEKYGDVVSFVKLFLTVGKHVSFSLDTSTRVASAPNVSEPNVSTRVASTPNTMIEDVQD